MGPGTAAALHDLGIVHRAQVAAWSPEEAAHVESVLAERGGRIAGDRWVQAAATLAAPQIAAFADAVAAAEH